MNKKFNKSKKKKKNLSKKIGGAYLPNTNIYRYLQTAHNSSKKMLKSGTNMLGEWVFNPMSNTWEFLKGSALELYRTHFNPQNNRYNHELYQQNMQSSNNYYNNDIPSYYNYEQSIRSNSWPTSEPVRSTYNVSNLRKSILLAFSEILNAKEIMELNRKLNEDTTRKLILKSIMYLLNKINKHIKLIKIKERNYPNHPLYIIKTKLNELSFIESNYEPDYEYYLQSLYDIINDYAKIIFLV